MRSFFDSLGEPEVAQLGASVPREQNVLRLQIPVHDVVVVQILKRQGNGGDVVPRDIFGHAPEHLYFRREVFRGVPDGFHRSKRGERVHQVAPVHEIQQEIQIPLILERAVHLHAEPVFYFEGNAAFAKHVFGGGHDGGFAHALFLQKTGVSVVQANKQGGGIR